MIQWMIRLIKTNPGTKLMAIFLACLVWFYIYLDNTDRLDPIEVPIRLSLPAGITGRIENLNGVSVSTVRVTFAGPRGSLKVSDNLVCQHRITPPGTIEKSVVLERTISEADFNIPQGVYIREVIPEQIRVTLFQEISKRMKINTQDSSKNTPAKGYIVVGVKTEPSDIMVKGPRHILDKYNEVFLAPVDVAERKSSFSQAGMLAERLDGEKITTIEAFKVLVDIQPEPIEKVLRCKVNALVLPDFPYKIAINPAEIEVKLRGSQDSINKVREGHISLFINVAGLYTNLAELKPPMSFTATVEYKFAGDLPRDIQLAESLPQIKLDVLKPPEGTSPQ